MKYYVSNKEKHLEKFTASMSKNEVLEMNLVKVYPDVTYQKILGMGGAFTEAAAYTYSKMSMEKQKELMELCFGEKGNQYNFCRTHIQSCDFSLGNYAYIEDASDQELTTFSLERDKEYLIPFMTTALQKNEEIQLLASPWSPPAFMKTNGEMNHGGQLKEEYSSMWADMIVKYIEEYEKLGIKISRLTVQNEPAAKQKWDSCIYSATEEAEFAVKFLRPALDRNNYKDVKINVWDHNKECMLERVQENFRVDGAEHVIDGITFHWYSGDHFEALQETGRQFPEKELIFTERLCRVFPLCQR